MNQSDYQFKKIISNFLISNLTRISLNLQYIENIKKFKNNDLIHIKTKIPIKSF